MQLSRGLGCEMGWFILFELAAALVKICENVHMFACVLVDWEYDHVGFANCYVFGRNNQATSINMY